MMERVLRAIKTFVDAFQSLEPRQQKAQLQTILKTAAVYQNDKIDLEFRGEGYSRSKTSSLVRRLGNAAIQ
jgi:hypothetical protein